MPHSLTRHIALGGVLVGLALFLAGVGYGYGEPCSRWLVRLPDDQFAAAQECL